VTVRFKTRNFLAFAKSPNHSIVLDPPILELYDPIAVRGVGLRVAHLNDGSPLAIQLFEQFHNLFSLTGMQIASGLIGKDQFGLGDHGTRDRDQLLLSTGKLAWKEILFPHNLKSVESVSH
jgi:hypothetical protein